MSDVESAAAEGRNSLVVATRMAVGLVQGLALYLLYLAQDNKTWPAVDGFHFAPLLFVALYVSVLVLVNIGNLRFVTLVTWSLAASAIVASLAWYGIWIWPTAIPEIDLTPKLAPSFALFFFTFVGLFIAQSLIAGGDHDRRFIAKYSTHFDVAWKLALQMILSVAFVGIFWAVLELGAALFDLIGLYGFGHLLEHRWFAIPVTTLALAVAVHLSDARAALIRGTRTLALVLLSWLLPLMTGIAAAFLVSLVFTGLAPLWKTGFAAGYLLSAAAVLVILINACYQDGDLSRLAQPVLRISASIACLLLVPIVTIAGYAIYLRVMQYGWTTDRVFSAACLFVAAFYAVGYAFAALPSGPWLVRMPLWNFFAALLVLAVLATIFSPLADPMRISVNSQVARLESGKIKAEKFDFDYLRWRSGRFGIAALQRLTHVSGIWQAEFIRNKANAIIAESIRSTVVQTFQPKDIKSNITVYPHGRAIPESFLKQDWSKVPGSLPPCLYTFDHPCDAYIFDFLGDGKEEVAIVGGPPSGGIPYNNGLFGQGPGGTWILIGRPDLNWSCPTVATALQSGKLEFVAPSVPRWREVSAGGKRLSILSLDLESATCPK